MLWPIVLPFQLTCGIMVVVVPMLTVFASPKKWGRFQSFLFYSAIASVAFVPSCTGIMLAVDAVRFGDFHYASYGDIPDFRSQRYLPTEATDIRIRKHANGYLARYKISAADLTSYLDDLWERHGEYSAIQRDGYFDEGHSVDPESFVRVFGDLGWDCPSTATIHHSPGESDGGGATYYVDAAGGLVYQRTGFW